MQIILFRKMVDTYDYAINTDILWLNSYRIIRSKWVRFIQNLSMDRSRYEFTQELRGRFVITYQVYHIYTMAFGVV